MNIKDRIQILYSGGAIDEEIKNLAFDAISWLEKKDINLEDEKGHMFITHFVMSLQRMRKGEQIEDLDSCIMEELQDKTGYTLTQDFVNFIEKKAKIQLPEGEKGYILLHMCNLLGKE